MATRPTGPRLWPNVAGFERRKAMQNLHKIMGETRKMRDDAQTPVERIQSISRILDWASEALAGLESVGPAQLKARLDDATPIHEEVR